MKKSNKELSNFHDFIFNKEKYWSKDFDPGLLALN